MVMVKVTVVPSFTEVELGDIAYETNGVTGLEKLDASDETL